VAGTGFLPVLASYVSFPGASWFKMSAAPQNRDTLMVA
jgi:hypothetical protein